MVRSSSRKAKRFSFAQNRESRRHLQKDRAATEEFDRLPAERGSIAPTSTYRPAVTVAAFLRPRNGENSPRNLWSMKLACKIPDESRAKTASFPFLY